MSESTYLCMNLISRKWHHEIYKFDIYKGAKKIKRQTLLHSKTPSVKRNKNN